MTARAATAPDATAVAISVAEAVEKCCADGVMG